MNLTLRWKNRNAQPVTVTIHRGTAPLDPANLPAPIATLTGGEDTYTDNDTVRNTLYYYVFKTEGNGDTVISRNYPMRAVRHRGHGPTELLTGDYQLGYFGKISAQEFCGTADLRRAIGIGGGTVTEYVPGWHKFVRNNKILFIPDKVLVKNVAWSQFYAAGAVYGKDDTGPAASPSNKVQDAKITIGGYTYRIRLPKGISEDGIDGGNGSTNVAGPGTICEYNDLVYPLMSFTPPGQRLYNVQQVTPLAFGMPSTVYGILCQELVTDNPARNIHRGTSVASRDGAASYSSTPIAVANFGWLPVLELIET